MFADPQSRDVRERGSTALVLFVPIVLFAAARAVSRKTALEAETVLGTVLVYGYAYWLSTSHFGRYSLVYLPPAAVLLAAMLGNAAGSVPWRRVLALAALVLSCVPSPSSWAQTARSWLVDTPYMLGYYVSAESWLEPRSPAYREMEDYAHLVNRAGATQAGLYVFDLPSITFFAHQRGLATYGDAFGPFRYRDVAYAIGTQQIAQYARARGIGAILIGDFSVAGTPGYAGLREALTEAGWRHYRYPDSVFTLYVDPRLPALRPGEGQFPPPPT
jgi:hypothetical protein